MKPNKEFPFTDQGNPQFFYEVVQYWVAFELVQVFHKYGLKPMFKANREKWLNHLHCIVQLLKKIPQTEENDKRAQEGTDILFKPAKTEHYGSFQGSEYGTRNNFQNLNFAIPLVILTWHRMLQEFNWKNSDHTFFELGNYRGQWKKNTNQPLDNLHMIEHAPLGARAYP